MGQAGRLFPSSNGHVLGLRNILRRSGNVTQVGLTTSHLTVSYMVELGFRARPRVPNPTQAGADNGASYCFSPLDAPASILQVSLLSLSCGSRRYPSLSRRIGA